MNITKNFTLEEMYHSDTAIRKKIDNYPTPSAESNLYKLVQNILQPIRDKWKQPIAVNSGYRNKELNKAVGGVPTSQHLTGEAVDVTSSNNKALYSLIKQMIKDKEIEVGQLIDESNLKWIHISLPNSKHKNEILKL